MNRHRFLMLLPLLALSGHGAGTPTGKLIDQYADCRAFLVHSLGAGLPEGCGSVRAARQ